MDHSRHDPRDPDSDPDPKDRLIVALDVSSIADAQSLVQSIGDSASIYKVGLQLFISEGPELVRQLVRSGKRVFLDLKLHDIPNTVAKAVQAAAELEVEMLTVHSLGGTRMLAAAAEAARSARRPPCLLGVTVLTSMDESELHAAGISAKLDDHVLNQIRLLEAAGIQGVVASPWEIVRIRKEFGSGTKLVCPGIRPTGADLGDQRRTATPLDAIRAGADYLVVGRPISGAASPSSAAESILREIAAAESEATPAKR